MKRYSLRRRLTAAILFLQCALTFTITGVTLLNARQEQIRAFDVMLRGRADSLLGAVQDAEDAADTVKVDPRALDLPAEDLWEVIDSSGKILAHSSKWSVHVQQYFDDINQPRTFRDDGHPFRGLTLHGIRQVDADDDSPGISRPVQILYAASLHPIHHAMERTERVLLLSNTALLLLTGLFVMLLLRRGLAPLDELVGAAAEITPSNPEFRAPDAATRVTELSVLASALHSATHRLKKAFRQQEVFVHDAAHELKTAVTIVKSSLQLLQSRPRTIPEYADGLRACLSDCSRMEDLVQRMLLPARFEQGPAERDVSNLSEDVQEVATQLETVAQLRRVRLRIEARAPAWVRLSAEASASLVSGLTLNALQHTPENGNVEIAVANVGDSIQLRVRDTGSGIPPDELPHIFDRFYRGDSSRARSSGGTGLGLSICKAIVESCGGVITVQSAPSLGTTVQVQLPCAPTADVEANQLQPGEKRRSLSLLADHEPALNHDWTTLVGAPGECRGTENEGDRQISKDERDAEPEA